MLGQISMGLICFQSPFHNMRHQRDRSLSSDLMLLIIDRCQNFRTTLVNITKQVLTSNRWSHLQRSFLQAHRCLSYSQRTRTQHSPPRLLTQHIHHAHLPEKKKKLIEFLISCFTTHSMAGFICLVKEVPRSWAGGRWMNGSETLLFGPFMGETLAWMLALITSSRLLCLARSSAQQLWKS